MPLARSAHPGQHLIIDGDDTLWENNVYFEQAIEEFIDFLGHATLPRDQVRAVLDEIERLNSQVHGVGSKSFARNLRECYERLCDRGVRQEDQDYVLALGERVLSQPMQLIAGVADTVAYVAGRHRLILFTRGQPDEQRLKIDRSGLNGYFDRTVVGEKSVDAYRELMRTAALDHARTWMIGNSPRSDINPALAAGLKAVFIPHQRTWSLEMEPVLEAGGRLLVLERFTQLQEYF